MSKIETIKKVFNLGGLSVLPKTLRFLYNTRYNKELKKDWGVRSLIDTDMMTFGLQYGYIFNIDNPKSFTEKIHTYKLLYQDPVMSEIVDKYTFKDYVRRTLGSEKYVAKAYGIYDSVEDVEKAWDSLPNQFVLKSTISSDGNNIIFVKDKATTSFESIRADLEKCFNPKLTQLSGFARAYYTCKARVLAEEYMHELDGGNLIDYKFYCFNGKVEFGYMTSRVFESKENPSEADYPRTFFDTEGNIIPVALGTHPTAKEIELPKHFDEMIKIAAQLSKGFPFVRVDFYDMADTPLLGEMTFYPTGGWKTLSPIEFDRQLGEKFIIPAEKLIKH